MLRPSRVALAVALLTTVATFDATSAGAVTTFTVAQCANVINPGHGTGCGPALTAAMEAVPPGGTLTIAPGTYETAELRVDLVGTSSQRVTIRAADHTRKPVLRGWVHLRHSRYVTLQNLVIQATIPGLGAMHISCGVGFTIRGTEFSGAQDTRATANLYIQGRQPGAPNPDGPDRLWLCPNEPREFRLTGNVFSRPYTNPTLVGTEATIYHNIYGAFEGTSQTGGLIDRNIFVGNRNGAGIKLGDGKYETLGPWGVRVDRNTFVDGQRAIYLLDDVRNNVMTGNLVVRMRGGGGQSGDDVAVQTLRVSNATNRLEHTYAFDVRRVYGPVDCCSQITLGPDNRIRPDPVFTSFALTTGYAGAAPYGCWGTGNFE